MRIHFSAFVALLAALTLTACKQKEPPKVPLTPPRAAASGLVGHAKAALDSGNILFRAHAYDQALTQYQRASELAPAEAAPLLGILMVADVKADAKLKESVMVRLRKLDPSLADSSAAVPHSRMMQEHPKIGPPASG